MPKPLTGYVAWKPDETGESKWHARLRLPDGTRPWAPIKAKLTRAQETEARRYAVLLQRQAKHNGVASAYVAETVDEWFKRWNDDRRKRRPHSYKDDWGAYKTWASVKIGALGIKEIGKKDLERLIQFLDEAVRAEKISAKRAQNVWFVVSKGFGDACASKVLELRVRDDNPAREVRGPDGEPERKAGYLFPSEFLKLVSCSSVPLRFRRIYALITYLYLRGGELHALEWSAVHLELAYVDVYQQRAVNAKTVTATKTQNIRKVPIEETLLPLLRALHEQRTGKRVIKMAIGSHAAARFRDHLERAGIDRAELFVDDAMRRPIRFHDLRHTGITWRAIRGDDPLKIQRAAAHTDLKTTQKYINEAEVFDPNFGRVFPPLPPELIGPGLDHWTDETARKREKEDESKWSRRGSNPSTKRQKTSQKTPKTDKEKEGLDRAHPASAVAMAIQSAAAAGQWDLVNRLAETLRLLTPAAVT